MANPQLEDGYTRIANELLEVVARTKLSPTQHSIILVIWRSTYGFNKKEHNMSLSFINKATGYNKRNIQRELKRLEDRKIIKQTIGGNKRIIAFNKKYMEWIGETTIGETTIGETTIGETANPTIGETANPTIGETANQKRHNKEIYKDNVLILSSTENTFLKTLENIENYPVDKKADLEMYKRMGERYPNLDLVESIKDWATYKLDKPLKKGQNPRSQINTSFKNYVKWGKNLKTNNKPKPVREGFIMGEFPTRRPEPW